MNKSLPDTTPDAPLYRQIYLRFRQSIADGHLKPGDRVPSVRALAAELNLARGTVETAYQLLISEGYLLARGPAGTVVSQLVDAVAGAPPTRPAREPQPAVVHPGTASLPLQMGMPALDAFPRKLWNRLASRTLRQGGLDALNYPDSHGDLALRTALAGYLGISRGINCLPEQIFICAGYRGCLDLICRSLMRKDDHCWFEDPGYFMAHQFLGEAGLQLVPVPVDSDGLIVEAGIQRAPDARFAVVTPTHQSPLCVSLSLNRRQALLDWANRQDSWIIEDDYDSEYRYKGRPIPALKSLDEHGRVLYCGTFSKVLVPGLRLAYLVVPEAQVNRFRKMADDMHNHCPQLWQSTVATFIEQGHFSRHLKKMRSLYAHRRMLLTQALSVRLGMQLSVNLQLGGMHLCADLKEGLNDQVIAAAARRAGLGVQALSDWHLTSPAQRGLLMSFTNVTSEAQAAQLAERLAGVIDECGKLSINNP